MNHFQNHLITYEGVSSNFPKALAHFKCLEHSLIIEVASDFAIHSLNQTSVQVHLCEIDSSVESWHTSRPILPISTKLLLTIQYTSSDSVHTVRSVSRTIHLLDALPYPVDYKSPKPFLIIEDLFIHALSPLHIYAHFNALLYLQA